MDHPRTMIDYGDFPARLAARRDRWSLLKEVMDEWGVAVRPGREDQFPIEVIARTEERLGFAFPLALKEWYRLPFRLHEPGGIYPTRCEDPTCNDELFWMKAQEGFLHFHSEEQDCCAWGFRVADAGLDDPPVYNGMDLVFDRTDFRTVNRTWILQNASFSEWVLHCTISDMLEYSAGYWVRSDNIRQEQAAELLKAFRPMGFPAEPWFQMELFGGCNAILKIWSADSDAAWGRVKAAGPHPIIVPRNQWESYWEPTQNDLAFAVLFCRDLETAERFMSSSGIKWSEPSEGRAIDFAHLDEIESLEPYDDPFTDE